MLVSIGDRCVDLDLVDLSAICWAHGANATAKRRSKQELLRARTLKAFLSTTIFALPLAFQNLALLSTAFLKSVNMHLLLCSDLLIALRFSHFQLEKTITTTVE